MSERKKTHDDAHYPQPRTTQRHGPPDARLVPTTPPGDVRELIERLNDRSLGPDISANLCADLREAAAELERLGRENAELIHDVGRLQNSLAGEVYARNAAYAELKRMRAKRITMRRSLRQLHKAHETLWRVLNIRANRENT